MSELDRDVGRAHVFDGRRDLGPTNQVTRTRSTVPVIARKLIALTGRCSQIPTRDVEESGPVVR